VGEEALRLESRIPADTEYLAAVGRTFYNYAYLEGVVISTIGILHIHGSAGIPPKQTARALARLLTRSIADAVPPLSDGHRSRLVRFDATFRATIAVRNTLLHARPFTAVGGAQRLGAGPHTWNEQELADAAERFEAAAIEGNDIFHSVLVPRRDGVR